MPTRIKLEKNSECSYKVGAGRSTFRLLVRVPTRQNSEKSEHLRVGRVLADLNPIRGGFSLGIPVFPHQNGMKMIFSIEGYMESKKNNKTDFLGLSFFLML